jgi:hypothetical protein
MLAELHKSTDKIRLQPGNGRTGLFFFGIGDSADLFNLRF